MPGTLPLTWVDVLPIAISSFALAVSLMALGWQITKHRLDGARVTIRLEPTFWEPGGRISRGRSNSSGRMSEPVFPRPDWTRVYIECASLIVENRGRSAVTIENPSIHYRERPGQKWSSLSLRLFFGSNGRHITSEDPIRVEPGSRVEYLVDVWSAIDAIRGQDPGRYPRGRESVLRAGVEVHGRGHARAPWRLRWKVPPDAMTLVMFAKQIPVERVLLLLLLRHCRMGNPNNIYMPSIAGNLASLLHAEVVNSKAIDSENLVRIVNKNLRMPVPWLYDSTFQLGPFFHAVREWTTLRSEALDWNAVVDSEGSTKPWTLGLEWKPTWRERAGLRAR